MQLHGAQTPCLPMSLGRRIQCSDRGCQNLLCSFRGSGFEVLVPNDWGFHILVQCAHLFVYMYLYICKCTCIYVYEKSMFLDRAVKGMCG